ncbi:MAG: HPt (histidine-containing phosphotransfer) domain-containing protein [Candidatus Azotimanducaceae bacterium]|jgi:HPt (histidine-containing phosphotransfer) domain-containing protein
MSLEQNPIWDQEALLGRLRGKTERIVKLVNLYLDDMPPRIVLLAEQVASDSLQDIIENAHTIKGVSGNLSIMRLQLRAEELEQAAKNQETEKTSELLAAVAAEYEASETELKAFLAIHAD